MKIIITGSLGNISKPLTGNLKRATREIKVAIAWLTDEDI